MSHRYRFEIEYDGSFFVGWQYQDSGLSVQEVLCKAAFALSQEQVIFHGAGRTDKGVHALGQVAHVDFQRPWPLDALRRGLNFHLTQFPVRIVKVKEVAPTFDARFSACFRRYRYVILNRPSPSILNRQRVWWIPQSLELFPMMEAASLLQGHHNFSCFRHKDCQAQSPFKTLDRLTVEKQDQFIFITAQAKSFLHRQVRMMVGALVHVGKGCYPSSIMTTLLQGQRPAEGGFMTAPAEGLYLETIGYEGDESSKEKSFLLF